MRFDEPVLLYGAGREARSTRAFIKARSPHTKVYVTVDSGEADIEDATFIAPADLTQAIESRLFATIVKSPGVSRYKLGLRTAAATLMTLLILWAIGTGKAPEWIGLLYAAMGAGSALLYRFDKLYALSGKYRVSENNLHVVDMAFGIIGGLAAQEVYRHKTVKPRFVATTWAIALAHTLGLAALAFGWFGLLLPK